jgi:PAS domain S-box-containing protein
MAAGELVDRGSPLDEVVERILDLVVPAAADVCALREGPPGEQVTGVRVSAPGAAALEAAYPQRAEDEPSEQSLLIEELGAADHAALGGADRALLAPIGARSVVIAPLRARGRVTGSIMLALGPSGRRYGRADLRFLEVLAGRLGLMLDNARLAVAERHLAALVDGLGDAVTVRDSAGRLVLANAAAAALLGAGSVDELRATPFAELWSRFALYTADGRPLGETDLPWKRDEPGPPMLLRRVTRATGRQQWLTSKSSVVPDVHGRPALVMNVTEDVTEATNTALGQRLLVEAGRLLSERPAGDEQLQQIAELVVPTVADWCAIDLPGHGEELRLAAAAHVDPAKVALARRLRERVPLRRGGDQVIARVLRSGEPVRLEIPPEALEASALDAEHLAMLREAGLASLLAVPLRSGDDTLGVLTMVSSQPDRRFDDADEELALALARRVGDALRNARLLRDRSEVAAVLAAGLRPEETPVVPGCEVAVVYRPAGGSREAGGDFYDVIDAPSGPIVVMGDVVGKGAPAATLSAVARVTLHTAGRLTGDPRAALDELNHALRRRGGMSLTTVAAVALPPELPGSAELLLAGHPPPLLVRDGRAEPVGSHGPMLGAVEVAEWPAVDVELAPGDVLVLYTDGVLDAVMDGGERFGEARLARLAEAAGSDVDALAAALERELATLRLRDDVALVAIRCPGALPLLTRGTLQDAAEPLLALDLAGGPAAPGVARRAVTAALAGRVGGEVCGDALIVVSELVTNAVRHGGARGEDAAVGLHVGLVPGGVRIEVTDPGPGFEPGGHGPRADGGYGLHLLDRLATGWGVTGAEPVTVWVELALR